MRHASPTIATHRLNAGASACRVPVAGAWFPGVAGGGRRSGDDESDAESDGSGARGGRRREVFFCRFTLPGESSAVAVRKNRYTFNREWRKFESSRDYWRSILPGFSVEDRPEPIGECYSFRVRRRLPAVPLGVTHPNGSSGSSAFRERRPSHSFRRFFLALHGGSVPIADFQLQRMITLFQKL